MRFGKLVAVEKIDSILEGKKRRIKRTKYLCKCDCGNEKVIRYDSLQYGWTKSCGCLKFDNLAGKRFDRLLVKNEYKRIYRTSKSKIKTLTWLCKCDCGKEKWVSAQNLKNGHTRSCGCYQKERRYLELYRASKNKCYATYKRQAGNKNREFGLTFDEFIEITSEKCSYCGAEPSNKFNSGLYNGTYIYNGIDRVDSSKGYVLNNCVPCCKICNIAKHNMSREEFIDWVSRVYDHIVTGETWDASRSHRRPQEAFIPS